MRFPLTVAVFGVALMCTSAQRAAASTTDSDHDGLSDALEQSLLTRFAPQFMISADDCAGLPTAFVPSAKIPVPQLDEVALYGQATPRAADEVELHYYHLWRTDCGEMSHPLDAEHVSVLIHKTGPQEWRALFWYAAAHEDTVCDVSQIAPASALDAEQHGAQVWVSRGKHGSFFGETLCSGGCGGDSCTRMTPLPPAEIINVGEMNAPMNGAVWINSPLWPLAAKVERSDFTAAHLAALDNANPTSIARANPDNRQMRAVIQGSNDVLSGASTGVRATGSALDTADVHTGNALGAASNSTGNGLAKSYRSVIKALGATARKTGKVLQGRETKK